MTQHDGHEVVEVWSLTLVPWENHYTLPARTHDLAAQYKVELAEFALGDDTIMSVDGAGRLFFQSAGSGCIGNGTVRTHLDGSYRSTTLRSPSKRALHRTHT